jgi:hypothetical protein
MKTLAKIRENIGLLIPRGQLSIPRHQMPQIEKEYYPEFFYLLGLRGVSFEHKAISANRLRTAQNEIDVNKVKEWIKSIPEGARKKDIIVSKDLYVLDGNHTWLAILNKNPNSKIVCFVVDLNMVDLINTCKLFDKVTNKTVNEEYDVIRFI